MSRYSLRGKPAIVDDSKENIEIFNVNGNSVESTSKSLAVNIQKRMTKRNLKEDVSNSHTGVSPPKNPRKEGSVSPDYLLRKLQLSSPEPIIKQKTKYQNARQALSFNTNHSLPGRENELQKLNDFLGKRISSKTSGSLYISGPPGTGKTACLTKIINTNEYHEQLKMVYVNCTSISSAGNIYEKICTELNLQPCGSVEKDYVKAIECYLTREHKQTMFVLDEIDQLAGKKQTILYRIFEWPSWKCSSLILIGIANSLDLTDRLLIRLQTKCNLKPELLHFASYTKQQIIDIFKCRLEENKVLDLFPPATIQLLAAKISAVSGDIRRALDIGRRVIEMAEKEKSMYGNLNRINILEIDSIAEINKPEILNEQDKPIQLKEVMTVLNKVYGASQSLDDDMEVAFPLQQKILICSLMLIIKKEKNKDITIGRLHGVYRKVCSKRNILGVDETEFNNLCSLVETRGIIKIQKKKEPRLNRITLQWDDEEVTAALQDKQLIAEIMNDFSCLTK